MKDQQRVWLPIVSSRKCEHVGCHQKASWRCNGHDIATSFSFYYLRCDDHCPLSEEEKLLALMERLG